MLKNFTPISQISSVPFFIYVSPAALPAATLKDLIAYAREHPEWAFLAGIPELRNATWVDLPTSHWPMWSRPKELAQIIGDVARAHRTVP